MTSSEKNGVSLVEASSGERPFFRETSEEKDASSAGMKWTQKDGIWTKHPGWQVEESSTADPDLFPKIGEEPEAKWRMNWTQVNGIWTKSPEQDPDISAEFLEHKGIKRCSSENTCNSLANGVSTTPPLKRLRKKTTPSTMHIMQSNNITVAYATPLITTTKKTTTITQHNALVTRGDLLSTSKYYRYHKALGHTPQHIQHVSDRQKKRLLAESGLPTHMHKQVFLIHDKSVMSKNRNQGVQVHNKPVTQGSSS